MSDTSCRLTSHVSSRDCSAILHERETRDTQLRKPGEGSYAKLRARFREPIVNQDGLNKIGDSCFCRRFRDVLRLALHASYSGLGIPHVIKVGQELVVVLVRRPFGAPTGLAPVKIKYPTESVHAKQGSGTADFAQSISAT